MKTKILLSFLFICAACTGSNSTAKIATEKIKSEISKSYRQEIDLKIDKKEDFKVAYVAALMERTEVEILATKKIGAKDAVSVKVSKVPPKVRQVLIDIIAKIEDWKEAKFNPSDALKLIYQQLNLPASEKETVSYDYVLTDH